jgi:dihydroorotase
MPGSLTVRQARLVLPDRVETGDVVVEDGSIAYVGPSATRTAGEIVDGTGLVCLPGLVDPQVHFREPGLTWKEDIGSGSRAAAAGGVTGFLEMPNTDPPTTTAERLDRKLSIAAATSVVHYGFFVGATGDNTDELVRAERACGVKVFMGSSTGPLLVDDPERLEAVFAAPHGHVIAVHAEDEARLRERKAMFAGTTDPADHPRIRDEIAALLATQRAVALATKYRRRLHVLHVSSAEEADFLASAPRDLVTAETCPQYLFLDAETAYAAAGTRAQCNPPIRAGRHREALWKHLLAGTFDCIATDHAPHTLEEKAKGYPSSPSGMPGVEWTLPILLDAAHRGRVDLVSIARLCSEGPARAYHLARKGRIEVGYDGDLVLVDPAAVRTDGARGRVGR